MERRAMTVIDSLKSIAQTAIAVALVLMSSYGFVDNQLNEKIRMISTLVVNETLERVKVDDAVFMLNKAVEKFKTGDIRDIKRVNLEFVLKYQDQIIKNYPEKRPEVKWCASFYADHFVTVPTFNEDRPT